MNKTDAVRLISEVLSEIQSLSGRAHENITEDLCPIGDLDQFDSLNGVEATVALSRQANVDLADINAFVNNDGTRALTVSEIADRICQLTAIKESLE